MTSLARQTVAVDSFEAWRDAARLLIAQGLPPHEVQWQSTSRDVADLFEGLLPLAAPTIRSSGAKETGSQIPSLRMPRALMELLAEAACFRADDRWAFLYRVVWRWHHGERAVMSAADEDGRRLHAMAKTVHREAHKMNAFLRFRERAIELGAPRFVAWFEPMHDVLPRVSVHFARRMGKASWLIATPQATAVWDGQTLLQGPPSATGPLEVEDEGEQLWLAYYRSTFNPARLNTQAMELHMPVRYWKNMPEATLIPDLISRAAAGAQRIAQTESVGARRGVQIRVTADAAQPERATTSALQACQRCTLWCHATQVVPGIGPRDARIMLVGEQPGDQEDLAGVPFVGPAGQILDQALQKAGIDRKQIYITNAVKHFKWEPRGKRRLHKTPAQLEIDACMVWLDQEIEQQQPDIIVALGSAALKSLLKSPKATLTQMLGQEVRQRSCVIVPTYHPSFVLRVTDEHQQCAAFEEMVRALSRARVLAACKDNAELELKKQTESDTA